MSLYSISLALSGITDLPWLGISNKWILGQKGKRGSKAHKHTYTHTQRSYAQHYLGPNLCANVFRRSTKIHVAAKKTMKKYDRHGALFYHRGSDGPIIRKGRVEIYIDGKSGHITKATRLRAGEVIYLQNNIALLIYRTDRTLRTRTVVWIRST